MMRDFDLAMSMPSSNDNSIRANEIDALVEKGNWDVSLHFLFRVILFTNLLPLC